MLPDTPDSDPTTFTYKQAFFETHGQKYDILTNLFCIWSVQGKSHQRKDKNVHAILYNLCISMPYALICLRKSPSLGETLSMWPSAGDMRPAKPEAELPGSLGSGLKRQVRTVEVVTYFIQIYSIYMNYIELWYINGNRSSVHRGLWYWINPHEFHCKSWGEAARQVSLESDMSVFKDSCYFDIWPSNCQDAAAANSFVAFLHYTWRAF